MNCPNCSIQLTPTMTTQGVEIDACSKCNGVWLDKGEIFFFTKKVNVVVRALEQAIKEGKPTTKLSPKTQKPMQEISLSEGKIQIDYCPQSNGLWFDAGELEQLQKTDIKITLDKEAKISTKPEIYEIKRKVPPLIKNLTPLPNLFIRSCSVLFGLYALLTLVLITVVNFGLITPDFAILIALGIISLQFILGPWLMDISLRFFYKISWDAYLPEPLNNFIKDTCRKQGMKFPRFGILQDGAPQAFTYGHHPNNARIVISQGLIDLLEPEEVCGVVAHEIGHAKHWDMLVMTIAYLVPLILYYVYRTLIQMRTKGREDKSAHIRYAIAIGSYILYIISQYLVLWLSRTREYYADRFAGEVTKNPNALASALVKIAYGLAGQQKKEEKETRRAPTLDAIGALGIFDAKVARSLAMVSYSSPAAKMGGEINKENLQEAMKWDLWNPWAKYYELHSTHPLVANRLNYLSEQSISLGLEPFVSFNQKKPESYWDEFFVDLLILYLPTMVILFSLGGIIAPPLLLQTSPDMTLLGLVFCLFGIAQLIQIVFSYKNPGYFPQMDIVSLLKNVKVSAIRPVPCRLKGKIIGRGVPGLIWSEDFVMQDSTGIIFLDYRQPLGIWEFLFGLLRSSQLQDQEVTLTGWYRRSPVPYVELKNFTIGSTIRNCYVYQMKLISSGFIILLGIGMLLMSIVK
ncbi:MAG: M48 family metalloprotease [bacterium]